MTKVNVTVRLRGYTIISNEMSKYVITSYYSKTHSIVIGEHHNQRSTTVQ